MCVVGGGWMWMFGVWFKFISRSHLKIFWRSFKVVSRSYLKWLRSSKVILRPQKQIKTKQNNTKQKQKKQNKNKNKNKKQKRNIIARSQFQTNFEVKTKNCIVQNSIREHWWLKSYTNRRKGWRTSRSCAQIAADTLVVLYNSKHCAF